MIAYLLLLTCVLGLELLGRRARSVSLPPALLELLRRKGALSPTNALLFPVSLTTLEHDQIGMQGYALLMEAGALTPGAEVLEAGQEVPLPALPMPLRVTPAIYALLISKGAISPVGILLRQISLTPAEHDAIGTEGYQLLLDARVLMPGGEFEEEGASDKSGNTTLLVSPALLALLRRKGAVARSGTLLRQVSLTPQERLAIGELGFAQLQSARVLLPGREVVEAGEERAQRQPPAPDTPSLAPALTALLRKKGALTPAGALLLQCSITPAELQAIGPEGYRALLEANVLLRGREVVEEEVVTTTECL